MTKLFGVLVVAAAVGLVASSAAFALSTTHLTTDQSMLSFIGGISFVCEGRIGDLGGAATWEFGIWNDGTGQLASSGQFAWANGTPVPFSVQFSTAQNLITYTVGTSSVTFAPAEAFTDIFVRTRAVNDNTGVVVDDLELDAVVVGDISSAAGPNGLDILWISGGMLADGFLFTGQSTMTWSGSAPRNSQLAYQIKFVTIVEPPSEPIPEPGTLWFLASGVLGGVLILRRRNRA